MKTPAYKHLTFTSEKTFQKWLKDTTHCTIELEDLAQDLLKLWVADTGEILHCNLQGWIWNGKFINMEDLEEFTPFSVWMSTTKSWSRFMAPISKITYQKNEGKANRQPSHA